MDRYNGHRSHDLLGVVELGPFPKASAKVAGYNLYYSEKKEGPFSKINAEVVQGGTRLMVPYLKPGITYYFRMTSVSSKDSSVESVPGEVFARTAEEKLE
jgi:hypothetical protein